MSSCLLCRLVETEGQLCVPCTGETASRLRSLPGLYTQLADHMQPLASGTPGRGATAVPAPLPVAMLPLVLRGPGGMAGVTEDWLTLVHEERKLPAPLFEGSVEHRLYTAVSGLWRQYPWIAVTWVLAGEFAREIRDLADSAESIIDPKERPDPGMKLGPCPGKRGDAVCGKLLVRYLGEQVVTCHWCGSTYPPATWAELKIIMMSAGPMTARQS